MPLRLTWKEDVILSTDDLVLEVAMTIANGDMKSCPHSSPAKVQVVFSPPGSDVLASCPQLRALSSGDMSKVTCRHLFMVGRGCPFVLSGKTCLSGK